MSPGDIDGTECPGSHRCHGCLSWCIYCGDVQDICDFLLCDIPSHQRKPEILSEYIRALFEVNKATQALKYAESEMERVMELVNRVGPPKWDTPSHRCIIPRSFVDHEFERMDHGQLQCTKCDQVWVIGDEFATLEPCNEVIIREVLEA